MILRFILSISIIITSLLSANTIFGSWKISNKDRPFNFATIISYGATFRFNDNGTLELVEKSSNLMGSTKQFTLDGNQLSVFLSNKSNNGITNVVLRRLSSQTFTLRAIDINCLSAVDNKDNGNTFMMCKTP